MSAQEREIPPVPLGPKKERPNESGCVEQDAGLVEVREYLRPLYGSWAAIVTSWTLAAVGLARAGHPGGTAASLVALAALPCSAVLWMAFARRLRRHPRGRMIYFMAATHTFFLAIGGLFSSLAVAGSLTGFFHLALTRGL